MKKYLVLAICFLSFTVNAGQKAVTDEGNIVILNSDGTWKYQNNVANVTEISTNKNNFSKGDKSTFPLKSKINGAEFYIDPKAWSFEKGDDINSIEYKFKLKGEDLYGMAITEAIEVKLENLPMLALHNARNAAADARITKQEYRVVNDNKVIYLEMDGTMQGIEFKYFGYYHSDKSGSTQYMAYTGSSLASKYKSDIENFLNGFSIQ